MGKDMGEADEEFRERFQAPLCGPQSSTQSTTTLAIEKAYRNPLEEWRPYAVMFPISAQNPVFSISFGHIPSHQTSVEAPTDPATVAIEDCGAKGVATRDIRMLDGARK